VRIYNLFPLLAGKLTDWKPHLVRAADMAFDWVFVNPIQKLGRSRSLYSIADYFAINPALVDPGDAHSPEEQMRSVNETAKELGLQVMADLVINHCAADSPLVEQHPDWFVRGPKGDIVHPSCMEDGREVVWQDLARLNHLASSDAEGLFRFCLRATEHLVELGFTGFRCDAAYQIPAPFWKRLIETVKARHPGVVFGAETLGCTPEQTRQTVQAGFDLTFNSSKWWDFSSPWLMEQYELTRAVAPSVSFPESHDTERLFSESGGNVHAMKQRYLFAGLFSAGVMMPMGYEYGFRKKLDVVNTRPEDWEETDVDLTDFIRRVNEIKRSYPIFQQESITGLLSHPNPAILLMWKATPRCESEALIVLNKDPHNWQHFHTENLCQYIQGTPPLADVSPEWPMEYLPAPFDFDLHPGMGRVLVTQPRGGTEQ
jgi:starch synthase (maltosyl-transferring)